MARRVHALVQNADDLHPSGLVATEDDRVAGGVGAQSLGNVVAAGADAGHVPQELELLADCGEVTAALFRASFALGMPADARQVPHRGAGYAEGFRPRQ